MGLLDKILGGSTSDRPFNRQEGFAAVLIATVAADGHISDDEVRGFGAIINRMELFRAMSADQFSAMVDKLLGLLKREGSVPFLTRASAALTEELRETAFALSVDLVLADGSVEREEKALLESLQKALGIPDALAIKITEVLMLKNRG